MMRVLTATCFAAAFAVGLSAQQQTAGTTGATADQNGQRGGPRTVTGCLRAGDTAGTYMLTDVQMAGRGGDTTASTTASTAGSTSTSGQTATGRQGRGMPTTLMLSPAADVDLKAHVGHKIEVTGTMTGGRRGGDTGSTAGGTATGGTGGTMTGGTAGSGGQTANQGQGRTRTLNVTSVRMISESCS